MAKTAREAALMVLGRCRRDQAFSDALLDSVIKSAGLDSRDGALCTKLCYGVLQNTLLCDYYIDFYAERPGQIEPKVRDILRISVFQMLFMDRIPTHAAVSEGVELCKKSGFSRASGLVNAVLRRIAENRDRLPAIPENDITEYLSIKYSAPAGLVNKLLGEFGPDFAEGFLKACNAETSVDIQVNSLKTTDEKLRASLEQSGIKVKSCGILPDCLEISGAGDITTLPEYQNGLFYVQDAAARLAVLAAGPKPGDSMLDACAAPGGKSFAAALEMHNSGEILSCDIRENKLGRIADGAERLDIDIITARAMDASRPDGSLKDCFDLVLADVPCSGLGVIRKKPDIRFKDMSEIEKLPDKQLGILDGLAPCVKPGGALLYSTCTVLKEENGDVIDRFLNEHGEFSSESFTLPEPFGEIGSGRLSLYPHIHGTDGFFICKLRKKQ